MGSIHEHGFCEKMWMCVCTLHPRRGILVSPPMCFQPGHGIVQPGLLASRVKTVRLNLGKPFQLIALRCSAKLGICEFDVSQRVVPAVGRGGHTIHHETPHVLFLVPGWSGLSNLTGAAETQ